MVKFHKTHKRLAKVTPPWRGACWSIDDEHFDADGNPIDIKAHLNDAEYEEAFKKNNHRPFAAEPKPEPAPPAETPNKAPELTHDDLDLEAWGLGMQDDYPMKLVKEAIADRYGVKAPNKTQCLRVLVDQNIITEEQAGLGPEKS